MRLVRTNGYHPLARWSNEMEQLVGNLWGALPTAWERFGVAGRAFPALNVWEKDDQVFVEAEAPGFKHDQIDVSVEGNDLTIKGRRADFAEEGVAYHRRERGYAEFTRLLRLPVEVDADRVQASLNDGVLLVTLPKAEATKPRKIQVSPGQ